MQPSLQSIFDRSPSIRYVAVYRNGELVSGQRPGLANASESESDKYEELIVNPTLITLLRQRGNIDCGGMDFALVRYGHFFEFILPVSDGHYSVGIEPAADALAVAKDLQAFLRAGA